MSKEQTPKSKILNEIRQKIEGAYYDRNDYPPFAVTSFEDRPRYHRYVLKLLDEMETEK